MREFTVLAEVRTMIVNWSYTCSWGHKSGWAMLELGWLLFQYASIEVFLGTHHPFQETGYTPAQNNQPLNHTTLRTSNKIELFFLMHVSLCLHSLCGSSLLTTLKCEHARFVNSCGWQTKAKKSVPDPHGQWWLWSHECCSRWLSWSGGEVAQGKVPFLSGESGWHPHPSCNTSWPSGTATRKLRS